MEKYGFDFPISSLNFDDELRQIPPYNGFGDEEDSLSNVNRLQPKAPRKDYFKWVDNQIQLRFNSMMVTTKPEDVGRRFIITLFMNDDTVMVYEPQVRNSGIVSGKFLEKMKYKNKLEGGRFFEPQDFLIGKTVQINGYKFLVQEHDERTKNWFEQYIGTAYGRPNPTPDYGSESQAWRNFENQPPIADGRGWEQPPGQQGDYVDQYYAPGVHPHQDPVPVPATQGSRQGPTGGPQAPSRRQ